MRRLLRLAVAALVVLVGVSAWVAAQSTSPLEGAWALQEVSFPKPPANPIIKPVGLMVITGRHYSTTAVLNSTRPVAAFDAPTIAAASADQLRAVWGPVTANAGTFTITGNTLRVMQSVAKNPQVMDAGSFTEFTFTLKGDTLVLVSTRNDTGPAANPATYRYTRVR